MSNDNKAVLLMWLLHHAQHGKLPDHIPEDDRQFLTTLITDEMNKQVTITYTPVEGEYGAA